MYKLNNGVLAATPMTGNSVSLARLIEADIAQAEFLREFLPKYLPSAVGENPIPEIAKTLEIKSTTKHN